MFFALLLTISLLFSFSAAFPHESTSDHRDSERLSLPSRWYHDQNHPVHGLFKRQSVSSDGVQYAQVGSPTWSASFPAGTPDVNSLPKPWVDALNVAVSAGKIPNITIPSAINSNPVYPQGINPSVPPICSAYYKCRMPQDIWDAPDGNIGIGFDDGPTVVYFFHFLGIPPAESHAILFFSRVPPSYTIF
jgi:chitin deacetylase